MIEVRVHYNTDEVTDVLVSYDGKWRRCKHKSFLSAVFVIAYIKENVLHYIVKSKNTVLAVSIGKIKSSNRDERRRAKFDINTEGSAGAMEPTGHIHNVPKVYM